MTHDSTGPNPDFSPEVDTAADASQTGPVQLKKKEFLARVKLATKGAKPELRSVVEATLAVLGDALARGEDVRLRPFGRARVNRSRTLENGAASMTVKLRRGKVGKPGQDDAGKETLAVAGD